jgi:hypothetical protein
MITDFSGQSNKPYCGSNCANSCYSVVAGGCSNCICTSTCYVGIAGGSCNTTQQTADAGAFAGIMGGCFNCLCSVSPFGGIAGGCCNTLSSRYGHILGGCCNKVDAYYGFVYGSTLSCTNGYCRNGLNGVSSCLSGGDNRIYFNVIQKSGGSFLIPHPDPDKFGKMMLQHNYVESPTEGDTIYRYEIDVQNCSYNLQLPDYFKHLNRSPQVKVSPKNHFGRGYGIVDESLSCVTFTTNQDGKYNVLVFGTRKDCGALLNWKGVERVKQFHSVTGV